MLAPFPAAAELYRCGELWTNKPCTAGRADEVLPEQNRPPRSEEDLRMDRKRLLLQALDLRLLEAGRRAPLTVDAALARQVCLRPETSVEECRQAVSDTDRLIAAQTAEAATPPPQPVPRRVEEPAAAAQSAENRTIVVVNEEPWWGVRKRRHHQHERPSGRSVQAGSVRRSSTQPPAAREPLSSGVVSQSRRGANRPSTHR